MIQAILPIVGDLAGSWLKGKAEEKAAVAKTKIAKAEAEAEIMKVAATSEASWGKGNGKGFSKLVERRVVNGAF